MIIIVLISFELLEVIYVDTIYLDFATIFITIEMYDKNLLESRTIVLNHS